MDLLRVLLILAILSVISLIGLIIAIYIVYNRIASSSPNAKYKTEVFKLGLMHMLLSTDKKWKKSDKDKPALALASDGEKRRKRLLLIRHGESEWNVVFNQWGHGKWKSFPFRLLSAIKTERDLIDTLDSVFVDSPLSKLGAYQASQLRSFIDNDANASSDVDILKGTSSQTSVIASANLRRALSTCTIALWDRINRTQEKIHILSALQEITFNIDGVALAKPHTAPVLSNTELSAVGKTSDDFDSDVYYDASENEGDKPIKSSGIDRLNAFAAWSFSRSEDVVIAAGHSLYFRYFFQTFLPQSSRHISKKLKIANGGVIALDLIEANVDGEIMYAIDENTITAVHYGFEDDKKHKSE